MTKSGARYRSTAARSPPAEQVLDERLDEVLVGGGAFGCHDRIVLLDMPVNHPNKLGEANPVIGGTLTG